MPLRAVFFACALFLFSIPSFAQIVGITGKFSNPDGTPVNGRVTVMLTRSTVTVTCGDHGLPVAQVITFRPVGASIVNGVLGGLTLYSTSCLKPSQNYSVTVFDLTGNTLYRGQWNVPFNVFSVDVSKVDVNLIGK